MTEAPAEAQKLSFTLRREASGAMATLGRLWRMRRVRWPLYLLGLALIGWAAIWFVFARDLPSVDTLKTYEPPLPTNVRAIDGAPVHMFARERRVQLRYDEYPQLLVRAYLAAEDRTFFEHGGIDYPGILTAIVTNLTSGGRPKGASTITQQVAKNLLLTNELSYRRKVREAILAYRIEAALTKQQILELYLNQIFLGRNAYGVQSAARAYFGKDVGDLKLSQMAYLAILPKAPSNYSPERFGDRALSRRNWVLGEMRRNNFIDEAQYRDALADPLGTVSRAAPQRDFAAGGYFVEEVRRQLIEMFGEQEKDGPYSVYAGGLWVRTSLDPVLQEAATAALRTGLLNYDRGKPWAGPVKTIATGDDWAGKWANIFAGANIGIDYQDWRTAVVVSRAGDSATIGFTDGTTGALPSWGAQMVRKGGGTAFESLKPGDVIVVAPSGGSWALRSVPEVSGGMVAEQPHTGRIMAMQGGFDARLQSFNRATQAERQPGSTIKPFVYAAALDNGMTPASIIVDGPFCVYQGSRLGQKCFRNFGGSGGAGPQTMRWGVEQSRNLMTVRAASQTGMANVVKTIKTMGIGEYAPYLSVALGAGDTTVLRLTNAYSMLANQGRELKPTVIDYVQDRNGKPIFRADTRPCNGCNAPDWNGQAMPRPPVRGKQLMDAMTAFQVVHILEGVVQRGTATVLRDLDRPLFGKTGTTNGPTNVWFVGGTPDVIAGVYLGYDQPRSLGGYAQGGRIAAPIFKQFALVALKDKEIIPFRAPAGIRMVRIDRKSGRRVYGAWPTADPKSAVIWEAFKPESEPRRTIRKEEIAKPRPEAGAPRRQGPRDTDFLQREGGIY